MSKPPFTPVRTVTCARCGTSFGCGLSADCWCASMSARLPLPDDKEEDCLCRDCLKQAANFTSGNTPK